MSADAWEPCPFCSKKENEKIANLNKEVSFAYNNATAKEWEALKKVNSEKIEKITKEIENTCYLRIDGVNDYGFDEEGNFEFYISAYCEHCGRTWDGKNKIKPKLENSERRKRLRR